MSVPAAKEFFDKFSDIVAEQPLPERAFVPGAIVYSGPFKHASDSIELRLWRFIGRDLEVFVSRVLAAQGDAADAEIVALQHRLADLLHPSAALSNSDKPVEP